MKGRRENRMLYLQLKCGIDRKSNPWRISGETVEKLFSIVNARFLGVSRPFVTVRSLIVAHSVRSFFSASPPRICSGTFSTVSEVGLGRGFGRRLSLEDVFVNSTSPWCTQKVSVTFR